MLIRRIYFCLFLIFSSVFSTADCASLHAILVIDTNAFDLREAMISNYWNWQFELKTISRYSDLELKKYVFKDENANSNFIDELKSIEVESDDVILFYWSGHGFRTDQKDSGDNPWPSFSFDGENVGFDFMELTEFLSEKHPRLLISIADTCNNYIPDLWAPPLMAVKMQKATIDPDEFQKISSNYYALFREASGVIMAAGCQPGQFSWAYIPIGSIFTLSFIEALNDESINSDDASWELIFAKTIENLEDYNPPEEQTPVIEINLK